MDINSLEKEINTNYKVRYHKKEKQAFRDFILKIAREEGYNPFIQQSSHSKNIVFGDIQNAEILIGAHYDTPFFSRHITIITRAFGYWLGQIILILIIFPLFLLTNYLSGILIANLTQSLPNSLAYIILGFGVLIGFITPLLLLIPFPFANPNNANDNTSGVLGVLSIIQVLPKELHNKVAFVLFDNEEWGLLGSSSLSKVIRRDKIQVINLDCIGLGEYYGISGTQNKLTMLLLDSLKNVVGENLVKKLKKLSYPSDHVPFKNSCSLFVYSKALITRSISLKNYHSPKDKVIDLNKINTISNVINNTVKNFYDYH